MTPLPPVCELAETGLTVCVTGHRKQGFVSPAPLGALIAGITLLLAACTTMAPQEVAATKPAETPAAEVVVATRTPVVTPEVAPALAPEPEQIAENNIYFESGSTTVDVRGKIKLRIHADRLKADRDNRVTLVGHTDDLGSRNYNLALAEQRMLAVSQWLRKYGVHRKQIRRYRGDGERVPSSCKSAECRQSMRRVELVFPQP